MRYVVCQAPEFPAEARADAGTPRDAAGRWQGGVFFRPTREKKTGLELTSAQGNHERGSKESGEEKSVVEY